MNRLLNQLILLLILNVFFSCNTTKNVPGLYKSKFAVGGFFGTRINLHSDSTFTYRMRGDLVYDTAAGQYQVVQKYVFLHYKSLPIDTSSEYNMGKETISVHEAVLGSHNLHQPEIYLIGKNKLYLVDQNGSKVKRQWGYSRHRRYILFGKHWFMRKFYLKRIS